MGTKAKNLIEMTTLHELEPLAIQFLHALVSLVHDCVNITDQSQSTKPSTSNVFAVGEKDASKFNVKDAYLLELINIIFYIECLFSHSFADLQKPQVELDGKACVAVGQNGLVALYDILFIQVLLIRLADSGIRSRMAHYHVFLAVILLGLCRSYQALIMNFTDLLIQLF
ncbi:uncharacterized protein LOC141720129 isoform X3 [Apium graveolens]|uniref:uncharacterized protein LOC141720129 isoform X3 n=1 Tax=Apium graveolens TaxID=4045 RepID=UPI003D7963CA